MRHLKVIYDYSDPRTHNLPKLRETRLHESMASLAARELKAGLRRRFGKARIHSVTVMSDRYYARSPIRSLELRFTRELDRSAPDGAQEAVFHTHRSLLDWVNEVHRRGIPSGMVDDYFILEANWWNESLAYARGQRVIHDQTKQDQLCACDPVEGWLLKTPSFDGPTCRWVFQPHTKGLKSKFTTK